METQAACLLRENRRIDGTEHQSYGFGLTAEMKGRNLWFLDMKNV
jgi:hypothetical protein